MINAQTVKTLESALNDAEHRLREAKAARSSAISKERARIEKEMGLVYDPAINECHATLATAQQALNDARITVALSGDTGWLPLGTKVRKEKPSRGYYRRSVPEYEYGVVEVFVPTSAYPENTTSYRMPDYGDIIVRLLKKDGTAGIKFETPHKNWSGEYDWKQIIEEVKP